LNATKMFFITMDGQNQYIKKEFKVFIQ